MPVVAGAPSVPNSPRPAHRRRPLLRPSPAGPARDPSEPPPPPARAPRLCWLQAARVRAAGSGSLPVLADCLARSARRAHSGPLEAPRTRILGRRPVPGAGGCRALCESQAARRTRLQRRPSRPRRQGYASGHAPGGTDQHARSRPPEHPRARPFGTRPPARRLPLGRVAGMPVTLSATQARDIGRPASARGGG